MNKMKLKPMHWIVLSCILLVLVVFGLAYAVYVPKLQELQTLNQQLNVAKRSQASLLQMPVPKKVTPEDKKALAAQVPVEFDQSRFIKAIREEEADSGVVIKSISFADANGNDKAKQDGQNGAKTPSTPVTGQTTPAPAEKTTPPAGAAGATGPAKKQTVLTEQRGSLHLEGNYSQIRKFIEAFSKMSRLVTFNSWNLTTEDQLQQLSLTIYRPTASSLENAVSDLVANDPLLRDRTPISSKNEYDKIMNQINSKLGTLQSQHDKDIANLEIQQTYNRYMAGLLNQRESTSILDQEYAARFIADANPNIKEVLGLASSAETPGSSAPTSLLGTPITTINGSGVYETKVTLDINFTIYYVPAAKDLLPAPDPIQTYQPSERTDPVEAK